MLHVQRECVTCVYVVIFWRKKVYFGIFFTKNKIKNILQQYLFNLLERLHSCNRQARVGHTCEFLKVFAFGSLEVCLLAPCFWIRRKLLCKWPKKCGQETIM